MTTVALPAARRRAHLATTGSPRLEGSIVLMLVAVCAVAVQNVWASRATPLPTLTSTVPAPIGAAAATAPPVDAMNRDDGWLQRIRAETAVVDPMVSTTTAGLRVEVRGIGSSQGVVRVDAVGRPDGVYALVLYLSRHPAVLNFAHTITALEAGRETAAALRFSVATAPGTEYGLDAGEIPVFDPSNAGEGAAFAALFGSPHGRTAAGERTGERTADRPAAQSTARPAAQSTARPAAQPNTQSGSQLGPPGQSQATVAAVAPAPAADPGSPPAAVPAPSPDSVTPAARPPVTNTQPGADPVTPVTPEPGFEFAGSVRYADGTHRVFTINRTTGAVHEHDAVRRPEPRLPATTMFPETMESTIRSQQTQKEWEQ